MSCATAPACTTIAPSSFVLNGTTSLNVPNGALIGNTGVAIGGIVSTSTPSWAGLTSGTIAAGSYMGLNGSGQVVLGSPSGSGNVNNTTSGSGGNIMACASAPACTTIAPSGWTVSGSYLAAPSGATIGVAGNPIAGIVSNSSPTWSGLTSGTVAAGSYMGLNGSGQVVLGSPGGTGNVSNTSGTGSNSNIMTCTTNPCTSIVASGVNVDGSGDIYGPSAGTLGTSGSPWADLVMKSDTWTPTLTVNGTPAGSYSRQYGVYQTLGHVVIASFSVQISSTVGLSGTPVVITMPVTAANASGVGGSCTISYWNATTGITTDIFGEVSGNTVNAQLFTGSASSANLISASNLSGSTQFDGSCTYFR